MDETVIYYYILLKLIRWLTSGNWGRNLTGKCGFRPLFWPDENWVMQIEVSVIVTRIKLIINLFEVILTFFTAFDPINVYEYIDNANCLPPTVSWQVTLQWRRKFIILPLRYSRNMTYIKLVTIIERENKAKLSST